MTTTDTQRTALLAECDEARKREQFLKKLLLTSFDFFHRCSREGIEPFRIEQIEGSIESVLGYAARDVLAVGCWLPFVHPEDAARVTTRLLGLKAGDAGELSFRFVHKNGEARWVLESYTCEPTPAGNGLILYGSIRDITEHKRTAESLRHTEEQFRTLYEAMTEGVAIHELLLDDSGAAVDYRILDVNPGFETHTGLAKSKAVGRLASDLYGTASPYLEQYAQVTATGRPARFESFFPPMGRYFDISVVRLGEKRFATIFTDVTLRKKDLQSLEDSEKRYRLLVENQHELVVKVDRQGRFLYVSPSYCRMFGKTESDLLGQTFMPLVHEEDLPATLAAMRRLYEPPYAAAMEQRAMTAHGWRWLSWSDTAVLGEDGEVAEIIGVARDITDLKRAEREVSRARNTVASILDSMPSVLVGVDPDGVVTHWNKAAEDAYGFTASQARGRRLEEVTPRLAPYLGMIRAAMRDGEPRRLERQRTVENGADAYQDVLIYPLAGDGVDGAVLRVEDTTQRVRLEEMMVRTEKMTSLGGLAAGMAHEINNPLASVLQSLQVVRSRLSPDKAGNREHAEAVGLDLDSLAAYMRRRDLDAFLDGIHEAGIRASRIVSNMLGFSRSSAGVFTRCALPDIVDKAFELADGDYELKAKYDFRKIRIVRDYDPALPEIPCQRLEMEQVFFNLIKNAAQAFKGLPRGEDREPPTIRVTMRLQEPGNGVVVEVADNGPGMAEDIARRAFEPFFTTKDVGVGTGLGLSVAYFIVSSNHNGRIELRSTPGQGSCFTIHLPLDAGRRETPPDTGATGDEPDLVAPSPS